MRSVTPLTAIMRAVLLVALVAVVSACSRSGTGVGNLGPGGGAPGSQQEFLVSVGDRVFFETDSSNLTAVAQQTLDKQAVWLNRYSNYRILIEGHADERGSDEYNLALGNRRAGAAKRQLVNKGVDAGRIEVISFGEERPLDPGHDEGAWAKNRRDEFEVTAGGESLVLPQ